MSAALSGAPWPAVLAVGLPYKHGPTCIQFGQESQRFRVLSPQLEPSAVRQKKADYNTPRGSAQQTSHNHPVPDKQPHPLGSKKPLFCFQGDKHSKSVLRGGPPVSRDHCPMKDQPETPHTYRHTPRLLECPPSCGLVRCEELRLASLMRRLV